MSTSRAVAVAKALSGYVLLVPLCVLLVIALLLGGYVIGYSRALADCGEALNHAEWRVQEYNTAAQEALAIAEQAIYVAQDCISKLRACYRELDACQEVCHSGD